MPSPFTLSATDAVALITYINGLGDPSISYNGTQLEIGDVTLESAADAALADPNWPTIGYDAVTAAEAAADAEDVSTVAANVNTNTTDIANNAVAIATNMGNIAANTASVATNAADVATNAGEIAANDADIAANQSAISQNQTDLAANTADIAQNQSDITANVADIAQNVSDIAALLADLTMATRKIGFEASFTDNINRNVPTLIQGTTLDVDDLGNGTSTFLTGVLVCGANDEGWWNFSANAELDDDRELLVEILHNGAPKAKGGCYFANDSWVFTSASCSAPPATRPRTR